jgi:hypothetical protein
MDDLNIPQDQEGILELCRGPSIHKFGTVEKEPAKFAGLVKFVSTNLPARVT